MYLKTEAYLYPEGGEAGDYARDLENLGFNVKGKWVRLSLHVDEIAAFMDWKNDHDEIIGAVITSQLGELFQVKASYEEVEDYIQKYGGKVMYKVSNN